MFEQKVVHCNVKCCPLSEAMWKVAHSENLREATWNVAHSQTAVCRSDMRLVVTIFSDMLHFKSNQFISRQIANFPPSLIICFSLIERFRRHLAQNWNFSIFGYCWHFNVIIYICQSNMSIYVTCLHEQLNVAVINTPEQHVEVGNMLLRRVYRGHESSCPWARGLMVTRQS